jgi:hypothetical protein
MQSLFVFLFVLMLSCFNLPLNDAYFDDAKKKQQCVTKKNNKQIIAGSCLGGEKFFIFNKLEPALEKLKLFKQHPGNKNLCLVAFDIRNSFTKNYCFFETIQQLYKFIRNNKNFPLYEHIDEINHKLFFDVDIKDKKLIKSFNFVKYKNELEQELKNILNNKNLKFCWLNSSCPEKISYHLIVPNVSCSNHQNQQIKNYLNNKLNCYYLDNVYKTNQLFRMWNCSKFGQNRPLRIIDNQFNFKDTLINIYSNNIEKINPKIILENEPIKFNSNTAKEWIQIPNNEYLINNFQPSKYQTNVYVRSCCSSSLACPICISYKSLCKEKHHKTSSVYVFKKNNKTYLGCFRATQWNGDRHFLNLETNKVEYLVKNEKNKISSTIVSAISTFKSSNPYDIDKPIQDLLNQSVNFGKYKNKLVKDLFKDVSYVNWIIANFKSGYAKIVLEKLINYFNEEYVEWDYLHFRPKIKSSQSIESRTPTTEQWYKHPDYGGVQSLDYNSDDEIELEEDNVGCYP